MPGSARRAIPAEWAVSAPAVIDGMPPEVYHADPVGPEPSLSASLGATITGLTPLHAWVDSPRLNADFEPEDKSAFDIGRVFHGLMTGQIEDVAIVEGPWNTKDRKAAVAEAREAGATPLKPEDHQRCLRMRDAALAQLDAMGLGSIHEQGRNEASVFWLAGPPAETGGDVWNRCRPDHLILHGGGLAGGVVYDWKTTAEAADPVDWTRRAYRYGVDLRAAHYIDGLERTLGGAWTYRFIPIEKSPPHALSVLELDEDAMAIGRKKLAAARRLWRECIDRNLWPAWPSRVAVVSAPRWAEADWLNREERDEALRALSPSGSLIEAAIAFQAPGGRR